MQLLLFRLLDTTSTWESSISLIRNSKPSARMHARLGWHRSVYSIKLPTNNIWTSYQHETSCNKIDLKRNCLLRTKTYWRYRNNIQHYLLETRLSAPLYQMLACDGQSCKAWHYLLEARPVLRQGSAKSRHVIVKPRLVGCDSCNTPFVTFVPNCVMWLSKAKFWH